MDGLRVQLGLEWPRCSLVEVNVMSSQESRNIFLDQSLDGQWPSCHSRAASLEGGSPNLLFFVLFLLIGCRFAFHTHLVAKSTHCITSFTGVGLLFLLSFLAWCYFPSVFS